jgi:single-strand DNA-binding protein
MASFNKVILMGNLTRDPERRYTPKGTAVTEFAIAINRVYNTESGEKKEEVSYFDIVAWGRQAEICAQYLNKGRPVLVEGRLQQDRWEQEGQKKSRIRVIAENIRLLGGGPGRGGPEFSEEAGESGGAAPGQRPSRPAQRPPPEAPPENEPEAPPKEKDDIPF